MRTIKKILDKLDGKLLSIERNTEEGKYELQIGLPATWVYKSTDYVGLEEIAKNDDGVLLKVFSDDEAVCIDDLIEFVGVIIDTNEKIAQKEEEYNKLMEERKKQLQDEFSKYEDELDELREKSFRSMSDEQDEEDVKKKPTPPKPPKGRTIKEGKAPDNAKKKKDDSDSMEELEDKLID